MAIDFMVMPLSRYIAGDFVTPSMQYSWDMGVAYVIVGPEGTKECPQGVPFGGPGAAAYREAIHDLLVADLQKLPAPIPSQLWDERSPAEPCFHRVDPTSYGALLEEASQRGRGFLGIIGRKPSHLGAMLLLPCTFDTPFSMVSPIAFDTASAPRALHQLRSTRWSDACASAVETLGEALDDAVRLGFPLIVDM